MTDQQESDAGVVGSTADWVRAAIWIIAIVAAVILLFMFGIGQFCDCTTKPPA